MAHIDDFIRAQITPQLVQGEQLSWTGFVRQPKRVNTLGVVGEYGDSWLAAATNWRLMLLQTQARGISNATPEAMCQQVVVWWYQDLREVSIEQLRGFGPGTHGVHFGLIPHQPLGPYNGEGKRYDTFAQTPGLDGQAQFLAQFPGWLQQQVAARAFPMDPQRQALVQQHQQAAAQQQSDRMRKTGELLAKAGFDSQEKAKKLLIALWVGAGLMLLLMLSSFAFLPGMVLLFLLLGGACLFMAKRVKDYCDYQTRPTAGP